MKNTLKTFAPATSIHISPSNHVTRGRGVDPTCRGRAEQSYKANVWMYYVNLSQWREELGPVIKSIQDHMRADRKNGSNELSKKKKNWSQQETFGRSEVFRAVAVNMGGIDWRKESGYQRQLGTCWA